MPLISFNIVNDSHRFSNFIFQRSVAEPDELVSYQHHVIVTKQQVLQRKPLGNFFAPPSCAGGARVMLLALILSTASSTVPGLPAHDNVEQVLVAVPVRATPCFPKHL